METEKRRLAILGSTGSIGTQALDVVRNNRDLFDIQLLAAGSNSSLLIRQAAGLVFTGLPLPALSFTALLHLIDGTDHRRYTGPPDVAAFSAAPEFPSVFHGYFDVCHGIGVRTGADAVFMECAD